MKWEPAIVKSQLRLASQKLGQVQAKNDSLANITRTDVATLLQRGNVSLARDKAEKLIVDESYGDLLEELIMQIGVLLEHFHQLERSVAPSPATVESASTIIYAAPHVQSKDLDTVRSLLVQRLGPDFARSAIGNRDQHVSRRVLDAISSPVPSAFQLDSYMQNIAESYGITWSPDPPRLYNVNILSEFLDPNVSSEIDLQQLRRLCTGGLPDEPSWLRPRIWKLLLGVLPTIKASWKSEIGKQREAYYDLIRRLLGPLSLLPGDWSSSDNVLLEVHKELSGLPRSLWSLLEEAPESFKQCPLSKEAPEDIRISFAQVLEARLKLIQNQDSNSDPSSPMPEIRLEPEENITPGISLTAESDSTMPEALTTSKTLLPSRKRIFGTAHPEHCSALLRLLYLHNMINPGNVSLYTSSFLVPLYSALMQEVDSDDLAHVEADTFWLLEAMVSEFSGLEEDEGRIWMKKFSDCVVWADFDFNATLEALGLNPSLPHYSYRWLMPILTNTLPLPSLFLVWDALFSRPPRERNVSPKLEYLVDICASMLLRAKHHLSRLSKIGRNAHNLWAADTEYLGQTSMPPGQTQEGFMEALSFLQLYDPVYVGGTERILQTAFDLALRREQEAISAQQPTFNLGARFKVNMWKGFTSQQPPPVVPTTVAAKRISQDYSDGDETETSGRNQSSLASRVSSTFWRGITNQTAMEDELPSTPSSPSLSSEQPLPAQPVVVNKVNIPQTASPSSPPASSNIWDYAEKLKRSDTVASLSKVSTNWRAKALIGSWAPNISVWSSDSNTSEKSPPALPTESQSPRLFSPPPAPPKDVPVRDSQVLSPPLSAGFLEKTKSLISMRSPPGSTPKSAPKPLLLNSASPLISGHKKLSSHPRSASATSAMSTPDTDEWADVMRAKRNHFHRDSQSSVSSLSPSDAFARIPRSSRSEYESDTSSSRIVAINRRSVSPMAPSFRVGYARPSSRGSSASSDIHSPPPIIKSPLQVSTSAESPLIISAPGESESSDATSSELHVLPTRKSSWKKTTPDSDNVISPLAKSPRSRSKRYPRPANLHIQDHQRSRVSAEQKTPSPSNLTVAWPSEEQENITTPKATSFDSDEFNSPVSGISHSPRRPRKISSTDLERPRKSSTDTIMNEERPRKISSGHRSRKISTGSREVPKSRREAAAEEGDDEGYDELLSAYESETPDNSSLR